MNSDLSQSVYRLRLAKVKWIAAYSDDEICPTALPKSQWVADLESVANEYLQVFPADNDTPITKEWLLSSNLDCSEQSWGVWCREIMLRWVRNDQGQEYWSLGDVVIWKGQKTRGDLRKLCDVLGRDLKEGKNA